MTELSREDLLTIQDAVRELSNLAYPKEACGFVFLNDPTRESAPSPVGLSTASSGGVYVVAVDNVAEWPYAQFRIRDIDAQAALATGRCVAVWHSHVEDPAVPSDMDIELAPPGIYFLIYAVADEDLAVFLKDDDGRLVPQAYVMPE